MADLGVEQTTCVDCGRSVEVTTREAVDRWRCGHCTPAGVPTRADRRWTDEDRELVAQAIRDNNPHEAWDETYPLIPAGHWAAAVLDALTAASWRREADVRAEVSTEIAAAVRQQLTEGDDHA